MRELYEQLLANTFRPQLDITKPLYSIDVNNNTDVTVQPKLWSEVDRTGKSSWPPIGPQNRHSYRNQTGLPMTYDGDCVIYTSVATGAFMSAQILRVVDGVGDSDQPSAGAAVLPSLARDPEEILASLPLPDSTIFPTDLVSANDIGQPPHPTAGTVIPPDSPRILTGLAKKPADQSGTWDVVIHEQYWKRDPSSFYLSPMSSRVIATSHTSGRVETSSSMQSVAETVGTHVSAGWGPVSASISASLSKNTTTSKSVTLSESDSVMVQQNFMNETAQSELLLFWNLVDVYTWLSTAGVQLATIEMVQAPTVLRRILQ